MPASLPPWLQSSRGLISAGALLLVLLLAVPAFISTDRNADERSPLRDAAGEAAGTAAAVDRTASDPLAPPEDDWLSTGAPDGAAETLSADPDGALDCLVQPSKTVAIGSQTLGLIETIHVERGDPVKEGQTVVELEAGVEAAAVQVARLRAGLEGSLRAHEESFALSTKRQKRGAELFEKKALSVDTREELDTQARIGELELLQAKEARQLAGLELRQAKALLARRTLRAPISGVVTERLLEAGEVVDEETILKIAQIDPLRVDVLMPASRYGSVHPGMRATIEPEFPVDASVVANVAIVDPIIDAASGTFSVRLDLPNPGGQIPGGLHCTVKFLDD
ncbi:MAG: efflux RND transporter periplasmic adaptor subunit [bacterium]|nr:efflux RND transporter periplasmic adaptor subunit [bacterium]